MLLNESKQTPAHRGANVRIELMVKSAFPNTETLSCAQWRSQKFQLLGVSSLFPFFSLSAFVPLFFSPPFPTLSFPVLSSSLFLLFLKSRTP